MDANKKRLIAMVHVAKKTLGMAEESYRAHLQFYGNSTSSAAMDIKQLTAVLDGMKRLGFKPTPAKGKPSPGRLSPKTADGPQDERSVIRAVWIFMHRAGFIKDGSETALNSWVKRQTSELNNGAGISEVAWLQDDNAVAVLESLKKWCRRLMYSQLSKDGHHLFPQMGYNQVLAKWEKAYGAKP